MSDPMIRLDGIEKRYPGQTTPAVQALDLAVPEGEIAVLVGPSGCGKSTTLRLINRLIEPTSGRIELDGHDVTDVDPDELRQGIGYVIQQVGLFPHMTVAENVATVPKMLGWSSRQIAERVDELLELVSMDPAEYRDRYPRELSGGQGQRVGVARAMAADPPVLLMDEPFGAIDPITRERLQDEFLRLQGQIKRTVVFVTHDIDEAVKLGDRIALLNIGAELAQYDTPARVLLDPADEFVADFIGSGARVRGLMLATIAEAEPVEWPAVEEGESAERAREILRESGRGAILTLAEGRPHRWIDADELATAGSLPGAGRPVDPPLAPDQTLYQALDELIATDQPAVPVTDTDGLYRGALDLEALSGAVVTLRGRDEEAEPV